MQRKVKFFHGDLKVKLIESRLDKENGYLLSVREAIRLDVFDLKIPISNWNYYCSQKPEVIDSEPYKGERVNDKLIYRYAVDNKIISRSTKFKDFINSKKVNRLDEGVIIKRLCAELDWVSPKNIFSYDATEKTLRMVYGDVTVDRIKDEIIKELLK